MDRTVLQLLRGISNQLNGFEVCVFGASPTYYPYLVQMRYVVELDGNIVRMDDLPRTKP